MSAGRIDWEETRRNLAKADQALSAVLVSNESRTEDLLRRRAESLAARRRVLPATTDARPIMVFYLGRERYAVELAHLRQIVPLSGLTPLPEAPEGILGVMNFRGEVGTVWDLARLLELPQTEVSSSSHVLVAKADREVGFRVDYVEGRLETVSGKLILPHETGNALPARFLKGLTPDRIHLLDADALLGRIRSETEETRMTQGIE